MSRIDQAGSYVYEKNFQVFTNKIKAQTIRCLKELKGLRNKNVVAYHQEFVYLEKRYKFNVVDYIEPKPGVSPGPGRMAKLEKLLKEKNVKAILATRWNNLSYAQSLSRATGIPLLVMPIQTGCCDGAESYSKMVDAVVKKLSAIK